VSTTAEAIAKYGRWPRKLHPSKWRNAIPAALRDLPWAGHLGDKRPLHPESERPAKVDDPTTFGTFEEALRFLYRHHEHPGAGVGVLTSNGVVVFDLDKVLDGVTEDSAGNIVALAGLFDRDPELLEHVAGIAAETYVEVSPSGTGLHAWMLGRLPEGARHSRTFEKGAVEVFDERRFMTVTGLQVSDVTELTAAQERIDAISEYVGVGTPERAAKEEPEPERAEEIAEALSHLDPDMPYPEWLRVGMALREGLGEAGKPLWVGWSRDGSKYKPGEPEEKWRSFTGSGTGLGTIIWMAEQSGWERDGKYTRPEDVFTALPDGPPDNDDGRVVPLISIAPEEIEWLWPGRIPCGHLTLIAGNPGDGKSIITLDLAARLTSGKSLPLDEKARDPATVLLLNAEDGAADVLRPRFDAMGGDPSRVFVLDVRRGSQFQLPEEVKKLRKLVTWYGPILVIIDPLNTALPVKIDSHKDQEVRQALAPLMALAQEGRRIAIALVCHWNKSRDATSPLNRISGSVGIGAAARSVLFVGPPPDDEYDDPDVRVIAQAKPQLGRRPPSLLYKVVEWERNPKVGVVSWLGESCVSAARLAEPPPLPARSGGGKRAAAIAFLQERLKNGAVPSVELYAEAAAAGISQQTLERAREAAGAEAVKLPGAGGRAPWVWRLKGSSGGELAS